MSGNSIDHKEHKGITSMISKNRIHIDKKKNSQYEKYILEKSVDILSACMPYKYIVVDLDGTLIYEEMMLNFFLKKSWKKPSIFFKTLKLYMFDKFKMKEFLAQEISEFNFREWLVEILKRLKEQHYKEIILATGSNILLAEKIKNKLGFITEVFGTKSFYNCVGSNKYYEVSEKIGGDFFYFGNSWQDLGVFNKILDGCLISKNKKLIKHCKKQSSKDNFANLVIVKD